MQLAAGSWILEVTPPARTQPVARAGEAPRTPPRPADSPLPAKPMAPLPYPRGLLIDLLV